MIIKNLKKHISLMLSAAIIIATLSIGFVANGATIKINDDFFPDENFRKIVSVWYDENGNDELDASEVKDVKIISITAMLKETCDEGATIEDLTGIEYFTDCQRLRCSNTGLKKLSTAALTNLVELTCQGNYLDEINVSDNRKLQTLNCSSNNLTDINISNNPALQSVDCHANKISSIYFSSNASSTLKILRVYQNELTSLDVSALTALTSINCSHNHLSSLDLSQNTNLTSVTEASIGYQVVESALRLERGKYYVAYSIPNWKERLVSTSCDIIENIGDDTITTLGYNGTDFLPLDLDNIVSHNGVDYYYSTGLDDAESMSVHVNTKRSIHQVKFYSNKDKTTLYNEVIVNDGEAAKAPTPSDPPQCKIFDHWSEDFSEVHDDLEVYAIWVDDHDMQITRFWYNDELIINCTKCQNQQSIYDFDDLINVRKNEIKYVALVDVNSDGVINAKDYARLIKDYR